MYRSPPVRTLPKGRHPHGRVGKLYPINQRPDRMRPRPRLFQFHKQTEAVIGIATDTPGIRLVVP